MANLYSILDSLEKESRGERTDAEDFNDELNNVRDSVPEYNLSTGERTPNTDIQKAINETLRDEVRTITSPRDMGVIDNAIRELNLQALAKGLNYKGLDIDRREVNTMKDILTDQNMIDIGKLSGVSQVGNLQEYYDREGKLPSFLSLARNQFTPSGLESLLDRELDAIDNPDLSTGTRISTYDPITPENQDETFSNREITALGEMLAARDKDKDNKMAVGEIDTAIYSKNANKADELNIELDNIDNPNLGNIDYLRGKTIGSAVTDSIGKGKYGHYDPMSGEWYAGIPDEEGNYTLKDDYNWNKSRQSGIRSMIDLALAPSKRSDQQKVEGVFQTLGPDSFKDEGQKIEINVPTYNNDVMGLMNVLSSRLGSGKYNFIADDSSYEFEPGKETPLGQGDLPGMYWQPEAFTSSEDNEVDDSDDNYGDGGFGNYGDDFGGYGMKGGGHIFREVNKLKMNNRNAKNNLYEMIGIKPVVEKQYGGGLSDAYSTLADRRQNMYGMGQTPSQMSCVFQDPMEASAFSPVNMEQGGDIVVPKERMINDQPHELSYINPQEAKLLKDLGGSGRRVDGIPAYFSGEAGTEMDDDSSSNSSNDSGNDTGPDVTAVDAAQQAKDDAMYSQYAGGYSNQMSLDPDDRSGYLDSYGDEFGRNPDGTTKTRSQAIAENYQYGINNLLNKGYSDEKAKRFMDRSLGAPGGYDALSRSYDLSRSPEEDVYDNYLAFARNQLSPVMSLAKDKQDLVNYYRDLKEDEETEQYKEPGFFDKAGNFFGDIINTYKGKNKGLGQFLADDTRTGAYGNRPSGVSGGGVESIDEDPEDTENLQTVGENLGLEFSPTTAGERQAVGIASLIDPTGVLSVGQLAKGLLSGLTGDETVGTARDPITGELFSFSSKGNLAPISPEDDPGFANRDDEGNPAKILRRPIPLKPSVITEAVEEKEEVTTDGKLSNRAKASAESIKSLIKLRNASSDKQIDAIISDLGIDKAGLTVPEFLKELGIER